MQSSGVTPRVNQAGSHEPIPEKAFDEALKGQPELAINSLEAGCDPNTRNRFGWPLLYIAGLQGFTELAILLIEKGADLNADLDGQEQIDNLKRNIK